MRFRYSKAECLENGHNLGQFDNLVLRSVHEKKSISLTVHSGEAEISLLDEGRSNQPFEVQAKGLPEHVINQPLGIGSQLLLPLLTDITHITLPSKHIFFIRRNQRTIADFFMRNLCLVLSRRTNVRINISSEPQSQIGKTLSSELSKRYLWVLRTLVVDSQLSQPHLAEKLFMNRYLGVINFQNELLQKGAEEIRDRISSSEDRDFLNNQNLKEKFVQLREDVIAQMSI